MNLPRTFGEKWFLRSALAIAVAVITALALWIISTPLQWVILTIETDRTEYSVGEPVKIHIQLKNYGLKGVELTYANSLVFIWGINDAYGQEVFSGPRTALMVITHVELHPGHSKSYQETWAQVNDTGDSVDVPGTYYIYVWSPAHEYWLRAGTHISISG